MKYLIRAVDLIKRATASIRIETININSILEVGLDCLIRILFLQYGQLIFPEWSFGNLINLLHDEQFMVIFSFKS